MKAHDWFVDQREDFVARALDSADEQLMREHLARCVECGTEVAVIEDELAMLAMAVPPVPPRPGFTSRVIRELIEQRVPTWQRWITPIAAAATVVLAVGLAWAAHRQVDHLTVALEHAESHADALADTLSVLRQASTVMQASFAKGRYDGGITIFADSESHRWNVIVHGLPEPGPDHRYVFWFVTADGMVWGADVICEGGRPAMLTLPMPPGARGIRGGALTVEAAQSDPRVPSGLELAHVEI
ncbi:MAG: anti-sigma factor [Gemmatimonadota bacterium]